MAIFRVIISATMFGQTCQNVLMFDDNGGALTAVNVCAKINTFWMPDWKGLQHNQVVWNDIAATPVSPVLGITNHLTVSIAGNGNATAAADVPVICYLVKVQTATPGRAGRGRIYSPGPSIAGGNLGILTGPTIAAVQAKLDNIKLNFRASSPPSGLTYGIAPRGNPSAFKPMIDMQIRSTYGTQRRRNYGVGI